MSEDFGLKEGTIAAIRDAFTTFPQVEKVLLYGSRAKGNFRDSSDIDLTLVGGEELNLAVLTRIMNVIDDLLLPYSVDLSIFSQIEDQDLLDHIRRVGKTFYEKSAS